MGSSRGQPVGAAVPWTWSASGELRLRSRPLTREVGRRHPDVVIGIGCAGRFSTRTTVSGSSRWLSTWAASTSKAVLLVDNAPGDGFVTGTTRRRSSTVDVVGIRPHPRELRLRSRSRSKWADDTRTWSDALGAWSRPVCVNSTPRSVVAVDRPGGVASVGRHHRLRPRRDDQPGPPVGV